MKPLEGIPQQDQEEKIEENADNQTQSGVSNEVRTTKVLREFTKERAQEERDELAHEVREKRRERHTQLTEAKEKKETSEKNLDNLDVNIAELSRELGSVSDNFYSKLVNFLKIKKIQEQLNALKNSKTTIEAEKSQAESTADLLSKTGENVPAEFVESKKAVEDFYKKQAEKWSNLPYESADIEKYFNPEYLASLPIEEYTTLLKRFGGDMVTHVTRQGIRDHVGMMEHSVGMGRAWNGFKDLTKEGKLEYNLALRITDEEKEKKIANYFGLKNISSREEALRRLHEFTDLDKQHHAGSFVDFHAVHFAVKAVADSFYGSESGNEIFIAYPSYVMAANYFHRNDPHVPIESSNYNDVWVYVEEDDEMNVDAGITFIPKNAQVNPETGSKYEINTKGEAIIDDTRIAELQNLLSRPRFVDFAKKAEEALGHMGRDVVDDYLQGNYRYDSEEKFAIINNLINDLKQVIPDINSENIKIIMDYEFLLHLRIDRINFVQSRLIDLGMYYKKTSTTVSSQEYWENYFSKNPEQKPSKIFYYEGDDPTKALDDWKRKNNLSDKKAIELPNKRIVEGQSDNIPPKITGEMSRFRSIAEKVIDDYYTNK